MIRINRGGNVSLILQTVPDGSETSILGFPKGLQNVKKKRSHDSITFSKVSLGNVNFIQQRLLLTPREDPLIPD